MHFTLTSYSRPMLQGAPARRRRRHCRAVNPCEEREKFMSSLTTTHDVCPQEPAPSNGASLSLSEDLFAKFKAMTIPEWADEINYAWDRVIKDVIKAGQLLLACKDLVPHGQWERLFCKGVLRMTRQTAFRLMAIAKHPVLSNSTHVQQLRRS